MTPADKFACWPPVNDVFDADIMIMGGGAGVTVIDVVAEIDDDPLIEAFTTTFVVVVTLGAVNVAMDPELTRG